MEGNNQKSPTLSAQATAVISYFSLIGWFVAFALGDRDKVKKHMHYSLVLAICTIALPIVQASLGVGMVFSGYGLMAWPMWICRIGSLVVFVGWIIGLINAIKGADDPLPFVDTSKFITHNS